MPLSEFATPLAKSLVGSTAKLASVLQHKVETKRWTNQSRSIAERITATFSPGLASSLKPTDIAATSEFLASQAFTELCFQTLTIRMVTNSDAVERLTKDYIERHLRPIVHAESAKQLSIALSGALTQASDLLLGDATFIQVFRSETIRREAHERLATLLLDSIDARLAAISAAFTTSSPEDIDAFEKRYRLQVQSRYRKITPPTFGTQKSVPFGKVYVPAVLDCGGESVVLGDFLATFHRAVVAGDPGGGKRRFGSEGGVRVPV